MDEQSFQPVLQVDAHQEETTFTSLSSNTISALKDLILAADPSIPDEVLYAFVMRFKERARKIESQLLHEESTKSFIHEAISVLQKECLQEVISYYKDNNKTSILQVFNSMRTLQKLAADNSQDKQDSSDKNSDQDMNETDKNYLSDEMVHARKKTDDVKRFILSLKTFAISSLPVIEWLPKYRLQQFKGDLIAALAVGFMIIPQGLAYALLAGMPPIYGLYTALTPLFVYFFFGSSRELAVGPTAMVSLVIPTVVGDLAQQRTQEYADLVLFYSLIYGIVMFLLGVFRIAFLLENILSRPALNGFTLGAAILIAFSQLKNLLGIPAIHVNYTVPELLTAIIHHADLVNPWAAIMGIISVIIIMFFKKVRKSFPSIIFVLAGAILITWATDLENHNVPIVGKVPSGFPSFKKINVTEHEIADTFGPVLVLVFMGFVESVSVAKKFAAENQYHLHVSQELLALGLASMIGCAFQSYPVSGSLPRTVVNAHTGSKTPMSSLLAAFIVGFILLVATPLIYYTPLCVLAAIVTSAALAVINFSDIIFLWKVNEKVDLLKYLLTMFATMFFGPIMGVVFAGLLSLLQVIYWSSRPKFMILGRAFGSAIWKDSERYANTELIPGILVVRMDTPRFGFYNIAWFREGLDSAEVSMTESDPNAKLNGVVVDLAPVNSVDSTSVQYIKEILDSYKKRGISFYWSHVKPPVKSLFDKTRITITSERSVFMSTQDAVDQIERDIVTRKALENIDPQSHVVALEIEDGTTTSGVTSSPNKEKVGEPQPLIATIAPNLIDLGERNDATIRRVPIVKVEADLTKWDL